MIDENHKRIGNLLAHIAEALYHIPERIVKNRILPMPVAPKGPSFQLQIWQKPQNKPSKFDDAVHVHSECRLVMGRTNAVVGAGVQDFTVYVSDNSGPFTAWLTNTTATQATYTGIAGHTYDRRYGGYYLDL